MAVAVTSLLLLCAGQASAANSGGYLVTYVARDCPSFADIFANRARNDIMESLVDLGPNTQYTSGDFLVNPFSEALPPQTVCKPISNWRFTLGTGYESRAVSGPWGSLSDVSDPYGTVIRTKPSTPLLDRNGKRIAKLTIAGAVTVALTKAQAERAANVSSLWLQAGTPSDPVLTGVFPGPQYAFGALRCAIDALNGDNVEFIFFPAGVKHVFCYGLYVSPPPTAGTITIQKQVTGVPPGDNPAFPFTGNLSFNPEGFQLSGGQSQDFARAGGQTWAVTEGGVANYALSSVQCSATASGAGPLTSTWIVNGATRSIHLVAGEHVTCVYINRYVPPAGGLTISKITRGGTGTFSYAVSGGGATQAAKATTNVPNVPVNAMPSLLSLAPGTYTIREMPPGSPDRTWNLLSVRCDGQTVTSRPVQIVIRSVEGSVCTFINGFTPRGSISLSKVTLGATGTATFVINSGGDKPMRFVQQATTTQKGASADAEPATPVDATDDLPLGSYTIVEQPATTSQAGTWGLGAVVCNGKLQPFDQGAVDLELTRQQPSVHCTFINYFNPNPPPDPTPPVDPGGGGESPDVVFPLTDLSVTKQASPSTVVLGGVVTYRVTVRNNGSITAQRVVVSEQNFLGARILSIHNPVGICTIHPRVTCQLNNLKPGAKVVVTVRSIPRTVTSSFTDRVAVGSATRETNLANNLAHATVKGFAPTPPPAGLG